MSKTKKIALIVCFMLSATPALAGRALTPDQSGACPAAIDLYKRAIDLQRLIGQIERFGTDEGNNYSPADVPVFEAKIPLLVAKAKAAEKSCGVGDQTQEAYHLIRCAEGGEDSQIDPSGHLGGSMEACPPDMPSDSVRRLNSGWIKTPDGRWIRP